ncbi:hypothetical protein [Rhodococcoides kyotonense]|uniref:Uncharacterized protein n=1 Tax=Rhodococcoides kyotonense TaxID=398843 RepID=A0A239FP53_9NOCA|nr:hypothetical protein [Rhodococcus kyotonensis]SNS57694.1 hypothetical protein SAMN05421642_103356 [Rhodococcus kyotonensis]
MNDTILYVDAWHPWMCVPLQLAEPIKRDDLYATVRHTGTGAETSVPVCDLAVVAQ